jgi:hypothetical protein
MDIEKIKAFSTRILGLACANYRSNDKALFISILGNAIARPDGGGCGSLILTALREKFASFEEIDRWLPEISNMNPEVRETLAKAGAQFMLEEIRKSGLNPSVSTCSCPACIEAEKNGGIKTLAIPSAFDGTTNHEIKKDMREVRDLLSELLDDNSGETPREYDPDKLN